MSARAVSALAPIILKMLGVVGSQQSRPEPEFTRKKPVIIGGKVVLMTPEEEQAYHRGAAL